MLLRAICIKAQIFILKAACAPEFQPLITSTCQTFGFVSRSTVKVFTFSKPISYLKKTAFSTTVWKSYKFHNYIKEKNRGKVRRGWNEISDRKKNCSVFYCLLSFHRLDRLDWLESLYWLICFFVVITGADFTQRGRKQLPENGQRWRLFGNFKCFSVLKGENARFTVLSLIVKV